MTDHAMPAPDEPKAKRLWKSVQMSGVLSPENLEAAKVNHRRLSKIFYPVGSFTILREIAERTRIMQEERAAAEAAQQRRIASMMDSLRVAMLRMTGNTWPVRGIRWTASVKARALSSTSNAALKTARMEPPKDEEEAS